MGCCEVKEGGTSNSELFLNSSSEDSFNDLSIFSNNCEVKNLQIQLTDFQTLRETYTSTSYKLSLETAFTLISPRGLQEKDTNLTCENTTATNLKEYKSETQSLE